jgi:branched-chain amino acid transport system permease protein
MSERTQFSMGDSLALFCALAMLGAFLFMPWFAQENSPAVSGYRLAADTGRDINLPVRVSNVFLIAIPFSALGAGALALWGLSSTRPGRSRPGLILLLGLVAVVYYYGVLFYENRSLDRNAFGFARSGFFLALFATLGLIAQAAFPREGITLRVAVPPLALPPVPQARRWWNWPGTLWHAALAWLRAILGWLLAPLARLMHGTPTLAYLFGIIAAIEIERRDGLAFARLLGWRRSPSLFGTTELVQPFSKLDFSGILAPFFPSPRGKVNAPVRESWDAISALAQAFVRALTEHGPREPGFFNELLRVFEYDVLVFIIPVIVVALLLRGISNRALLRLPLGIGIGLQILVLYAAVSRWSALNDYRELVLIYMGVNIMLAVSLNLVNGYMGEFSVGHAGFMAVGAYVASILTMWFFTDSAVFGHALLSVPRFWAITVGFLIALIAGGVAAALAGLMVAFPSFRTRGDYLAIVTLAVNFIVTGVINNIEKIGGPRGLNGVPLWTNLRWIFLMTVLSVIAIHNLVSSTFGKGIIAIREDEIAAELMGVHTRHVKLVAFMVSSFIAGVAGGLFAHVLAYVNPGVFGILKSTEALVMVYLGGMGSISGSIIAAVLFTIMIEALRPLAVLKWVVIPLILILLMLRRPQGLFGFREINLNLGGIKKQDTSPDEEVADDAAAGD